ncbi:emp24/gp25L/p24 family protein [Nitzschia inconspicua]|uniref:Emp24/gp25L/p24 family protein n=1 Tax=Nitzschia inconspicua TaxID=303405 RepID=A0A9K3Q127_9STRA|nr:emp24/gp25L/p24 family protein [Nitzschia inconspicua]
MTTHHSWSIPTTVVVILNLILAFDCIHNVSASYVVSVEPSSKQCFRFRTPQGSATQWTISGSFEVLHDDVDSEELSVRVSNIDTGDTLYEKPSGTLEGDFELYGLKGNKHYQICFQSNVDGSNHNEAFDVGFNLRFHYPPRTLDDKESGPDGERASKLVEKAAKIHQDWDTLQDHFDFLRNREAIHEEMNDAIVSRLTKWTYVEAFLVVGMATGQVMYWKKFFEKRRYL